MVLGFLIGRTGSPTEKQHAPSARTIQVHWTPQADKSLIATEADQSGKPPPLPVQPQSVVSARSHGSDGQDKPIKGTYPIPIKNAEDKIFAGFAEAIIPRVDQVKTMAERGENDYVRANTDLRMSILKAILAKDWDDAWADRLNSWYESWSSRKWENHRRYSADIQAAKPPNWDRDHPKQPFWTSKAGWPITHEWLNRWGQAKLEQVNMLSELIHGSIYQRHKKLLARFERYAELASTLKADLSVTSKGD